ncbi:hypothetical protein CLOSTMETH_01020 [[Clostridium] methylpentosum DSM 5476]|uniref:Uncharacterized protein n=1 Tax=[Clostridium] methylpentosum DSM 5476 TaxID=537013 RepID=C0EB04_9FIRM|nr:hypothetical protein CLOSTMETH_01020 [[Clostridium] methylpentosum DSM 5476]
MHIAGWGGCKTGSHFVCHSSISTLSDSIFCLAVFFERRGCNSVL